jgi:hypothetical protein
MQAEGNPQRGHPPSTTINAVVKEVPAPAIGSRLFLRRQQAPFEEISPKCRFFRAAPIGFVLRQVDVECTMRPRRLTSSPDECTLALPSFVCGLHGLPVPNSSKRQCGSSRLKSR